MRFPLDAYIYWASHTHTPLWGADCPATPPQQTISWNFWIYASIQRLICYLRLLRYVTHGLISILAHCITHSHIVRYRFVLSRLSGSLISPARLSSPSRTVIPWWPFLSGCGLNVVPTHGTAPCGKPVMMSGVHLWVTLLLTLQPCFSCTTLPHGDSVGPSFDTWVVPSGQDPDHTIMCKASKQSRGHFGWKLPRLIATSGKYSTMSSMTSRISHYASAKPGVACKYSMQIMELRDASLKYWSWTTWVEDDLGTNYFVLCLLSWIYRDILLTSSVRCRQGKQQQSLPTICQYCWFIHDSVHIRVRLNTSVSSFVFNLFLSFHLFYYVFL